MIAAELINHMIPPLKLSDTAAKAMTWMEELRCKQLPVVDEGRFKGLITEEMILDANNIDCLLSDFDLECDDCTVYPNQHFYDVVKTATDNKVQLIAVVDEDKNYSGIITIQDTITSFAQTAAVQAPGAIVVLSMEARDYSLSEISRLIEEDGAKILGSTIREDLTDPKRLKLTLKINRENLSSIVATLERFGYKIIARFQEIGAHDDNKERLDIFIRSSARVRSTH